MSEYLKIENFGPIRKAEIELKRYMLFIGTQASGKSTIAKLIAIFRSGEFVMALYDKKGESDNYVSFFNDYNIQNYFTEEYNCNTEFEYNCDLYNVIQNR